RDPKEDERRQRLLSANETAAAFFHNALLHADAGAEARAYLAERGLDKTTIEAFQVGYSLDSWDALRNHLTERGFTPDEQLAAGLLVESDRGGYDRFRNRLMFPIRDARGRVAGFGGRVLASASDDSAKSAGAKYINTPQSPIFDKSGLLYGLDRATDAIRKEKSVVVVEGYMDVIAAHQHGMANSVASMGTALTERQIRTLERFRGKILLAMDADAAGIEATLRALQEAGAAGAIHASAATVHPEALEADEFSNRTQEWSRNALKRAAVNFFVIPLSGKDPDEMIRADRETWDAAVAEAKPFTDHVFETVANRSDLSQPNGRSQLMQELLPVVRLIDEPVFRAHYVQRLARLAQVDEEAVRGELRRKSARTARRDATDEPAAAQPLRREPAEEFCLALVLRHPELRHEGSDLSPELFLLGEHRAILSAWIETPEIESLRQALSTPLHEQLDRILARDLPVLEGAQLRAAFHDCIRRIEVRRLSAAKRASAAALTDPDVQQYMTAAVEQAIALQSTEPPEPALSSERDKRAAELAASLIEDTEMGRRLHQTSAKPQPAEAAQQSEGER
ncbi:MAG: toprim domain-containing protein, partial [Chloroflexi bacterium]|nr:toprim domain-containing protein [Chloroflexota bacterium]